MYTLSYWFGTRPDGVEQWVTLETEYPTRRLALKTLVKMRKFTGRFSWRITNKKTGYNRIIEK